MSRSRSYSFNSQYTDPSGIKRLSSSDDGHSDEESLSSSGSSSSQSITNISDSESEDSYFDEESLAGIAMYIEKLAQETIDQQDCARLLELIIYVESFTMEESWHDFWGNIYYEDGEKKLDGLTPISFLLLRVNPSFFNFCKQKWHSYLEDNAVDTLQAIFFALTKDEEVYNKAFEKVISDSDKKVDVINFLAQSCDFIGLTHKFGEDSLPFGQSEDINIANYNLSSIASINVLAGNRGFIKRIYLESPDIFLYFPEGFDARYDEILKPFRQLEQQFLVSISNGDVESVKNAILAGVNVSCTRNLSELRTLININYASLNKIKQAGISDINGLTLAASLTDEANCVKVWAILLSNGIDAYITNHDKEYELFQYIHPNCDLQLFSRRINQVMNVLNMETMDWVRNKIISKTGLYPLYNKPIQIDINYFYGYLFHSQYPNSFFEIEQSEEKNAFTPVDSMAFKLIQPLLQVFAIDNETEIKFDLKNSDCTKLYHVKPSRANLPRGVTIQGKQIIVGARDYNQTVLAIFMHEICHAACDIVFTNNSLPYGADDYASKKIFHDIFVYFQKNYNNKDIPDVIKNVFEAYKGEEIQKAELIVRIPQLFTSHGYDEAISKLEFIADGMGLELLEFYQKDKFHKIFDYFQKTF